MPRVLVVDDDAGDLELMRVCLEEAVPDVQVVTATSGKEALKALEPRPDMILLDVMMPIMDGLATLQAIRKEDRDIPVLMVTAQQDPRFAREAFAKGCDGFLQKPLSEAGMRLTARQVVATLEELELLPAGAAMSGGGNGYVA